MLDSVQMLWLFTFLFAAQVHIEDSQPLNEARLSGFATIVPTNSAIPVGQPLELDVLLSGSALNQELMDPFWEFTATLPGRVAAFDEQRNFIGWLAIGSTEPTRDVPTIRGGQGYVILGSEVLVKTGQETVHTVRDGLRLISSFGPGTYFVQATYTNALLERSRTLRTIAVSEAASFTVLPTAAKLQVAERPKTGRVEIRVSKDRLLRGERFLVQVRFINTTGTSIQVYNPFCGPFYVPRSAQLLVFDVRGNLLSNLLEFEGGSTIIGGGWYTLPPNAIVGMSTETSLEYLYLPNSLSRREMSPGDYFLRAAYTESFFSKNPREDNPNPTAYSDWLRKHENDKPQLLSAPIPIKLMTAKENPIGTKN